MLHNPDLLSVGSPPTFDPQAISDDTDWSILCAGHMGYGVPNDAAHPAPVVTPCTATCTYTGSTVALSTLTGSASGAVSGASGTPPAGYFTATTSGGGTGFFGYSGGGGGAGPLTGIMWISGGSGNLTNGSTLTIICAVSVTAGWISNNMTPVQLTAQAISIENQSGTAWQVLPASAGDRKDLLCCSTAGVLSVQVGASVTQAGSTRSNQSYTNPPPNKPAYNASFPVVLTEIMVPGVGASGANAIVAGNLTDKSVPLAYPNMTEGQGLNGGDVTLTTSDQTVATTGSLAVGSWLIVGGVQVTKTAGSTSEVEVHVTIGSGAFLGLCAGEVTLPTTGSTAVVPIACLCTVSTAGAVTLLAKASAVTCVAKQKTPTTGDSGFGSTGITSLTAIRLQ